MVENLEVARERQSDSIDASARVDDLWTIIEHSPAPQLIDPASICAERLVLLVHRGINWSVWGKNKNRINRYWDALAERVRAATYAGPTLEQWWLDICRTIESSPSSPVDRIAVAQLIGYSDQRDVLKVLRNNAPMLALRIRIHVEASRERS